jgi:eukaryotic-like serine/threonine-protein kinase
MPIDAPAPDSLASILAQRPSDDGDAGPRLALLRRLWPPNSLSPRGLGRFEVLRELGHGGCGIVYLAFDPALGCKVALKVPRPEALLSGEARGRFLTEAHAAAALDHPNIVPMREAGEAGPFWYIVSAYCEGPTLAEWLADRGAPLPPDEAAALVATLADAVEHMHSRDIIHRDLKPGNILLSPKRDADEHASDGANADPIRVDPRHPRSSVSDFHPRITDFGLAKLREGPGDSTRTGVVLGTAAYMAPEQATGAKKIGPAADVYALGVILYELLAGRPPLEGKTPADTVRLVITEDPPRLRRGWRGPPRDLEAIALKCLQKKPAMRYPSAQRLANDLRRYLRGEPTEAQPLSVAGQAWKWARRRRALAGLIGVAVVSAVALLLGAVVHYASLQAANAELADTNGRLGDAIGQRDSTNKDLKNALAEQERQTELTRTHLYARDIRLAEQLWRSGRFAEAAALLDNHLPRDGQKDLRGFEWFHLRRRSQPEMTSMRLGSGISRIAVSFDGKMLATGEGNGTVALWKLPAREPLAILQEITGCGIMALAFSPDDKTLAGATYGPKNEPRILLWDIETRKLRCRPLTSPEAGGAESLVFSHDGKRLIAGGRGGAYSEEGVVAFWDMTDLGKYTANPAQKLDAKVISRRGICLALSPDGERLVTGSADRHLGVIAMKPALPALGASTVGLMGSSVGQGPLLAAAALISGRTMKPGEKTESQMAGDHWAAVLCVAIAPNGSAVASGSIDREVKLRDGRTLQPRPNLPPMKHTGAINTVAFSPDSRMMASGSGDHYARGQPAEVKLWDVETGAQCTAPLIHPDQVLSLCFTPDGKTLITGCSDGVLRFWNLTTLRTAPELLPGHPRTEAWSVAFSRDGKTLVSSGDDHAVRLWDAAGKPGPVLQGHGSLVSCVAFSPDGTRIASGSYGRGEKPRTDFTQTVKLWDADTGQLLRTFPGHKGDVRCIAFSPDGKILATGSRDHSIRLWNPETGEVLAILGGHDNDVVAVAFSPDGKTLASASNDETVLLWDVASGKAGASLKHDSQVRSLAFAPDGKTLVTGDGAGLVRIWEMDTLREVRTLRKHTGAVRAVAFSRDGKTLATGGVDRTVHIWQASTGEELLALPELQADINSLAFAPNDTALAAALHDGTIRIWRAPHSEN